MSEFYYYYYYYCYYYYCYCYLPPLCRVFTIICLKQTMFPGYIVCSYPVFTIYATCNVASHVKSFVLLHQSFLKYVCSAQCGGFLFLYFVFSQLLSYFLNDFEIVPVVPILTGIAFVFTLHMNCISVVRLYVLESSQLISLSHFCLLKLQHLLIYMFFFSLSWIIMSGLLSGVVLLVYIC